MSNKIAVKVSGSIVASLFFEHVNSPGDQEGFLLGELITRTTRTISDSHMSAEKEETSIHIYTIMPCDEQSFSFYDGSGRLQKEKLNYYIKDKEKDVIGWYKFRRNTPLEISLREQAVHENLCRALECHNFLFGIFTSCDTHDTSTYTFDHIILRSTRLNGKITGISVSYQKERTSKGITPSSRGFERSSLNIINLGTTSHAEYLLHPHDATNIFAGCFSEAVNTVNVGYIASVNQVLEMHKELRVRLESMKEDVASAEAIVGSMCLDVAELEAKVRTLQALKRGNKMQYEYYKDDEEQESEEEPVQPESVEYAPVSHQDSLEQTHSDLQRTEQNAPVEENFPVNVNGSSNTEGENKATYCNPEGGSNAARDAAT